MYLVGDIGGTKTDLALFATDNILQPVHKATFKSADFKSLEAVAQTFLAGKNITVSKAVFGVAGPVVHGTSNITNLPWKIAEETLCQELHLTSAKLLNDLEAIAYAVPHLPPEALATINNVAANTSLSKHKAVIAPGTGLGEAILFYHTNGYHIIASEGGHASFAPTTLFEIELLKSLLGKLSHVSYERVCSGGLGIPNIYNYLKENRYAKENPEIATAIKDGADPTPVIIQAGLQESCELCITTLNAFVAILGSEASNLALKVMAMGGIYLGGGIPPRILPKLKDGTFMAAFVKKGRFSEMLSQVPVYVILHQQPGLLGAAYYAAEM